VLGVRLAVGALAERHGRVARLPQQQVALEERGHGQRRGVQERHDLHVTPHGGQTTGQRASSSSWAAVADRVVSEYTNSPGLRGARGRVFGGAVFSSTRTKRSLVTLSLPIIHYHTTSRRTRRPSVFIVHSSSFRANNGR